MRSTTVPGFAHSASPYINYITYDADLGPACVIGPGVRIGAYTRLVARVTVLAEAPLGRRCLVHPGTVIGADGFGLARERGVWIKIPQIGSVHIRLSWM